MEANWQISSGLKNNTGEFKDDFFKRYTLKPRQKSLALNADIEKDYVFPTFYSHVCCSVGIFLCDFDAAKKIMLDSEIVPVKMPYNRSLVIFSSYEYRNVYNIAPYNEIAMTIPVMAKASFSPPLLPLLFSSWFKAFGYYVFSMPVTSYENEIRGQKLWGLPKKTQKIDIMDEEGCSQTKSYNKEGSCTFSLKIPKKGSKKNFDLTSPLYSKKEDQILKSHTSFKGDFVVTKNMGLIFKKDLGASFSSEHLSFDSSSEEGQILKNLKIHPVPMQTRYAKDMNSCFDLPEKTYKFN